MPNSTLSEKQILEDIEKISQTKHMFPEQISSPFSFGELQVHTLPPAPQKLRLSEHVQVSDKFRADFNLWLLDRFGLQESLLSKNHCYMFQNSLIMRPEHIAALINYT